MNQYTNLDKEISECRTPLSCQVCLCDSVCPNSVSREPQAGECGHTLGPTAQTHPTTTHRHIYLLETTNTAAPGIPFLVWGSRLQWYSVPFRHGHGSRLWLPADDRAVLTWQVQCCLTLPVLLEPWHWAHVSHWLKAVQTQTSALLSWAFMVPNEYFMCDTKIATILWVTSNRPLILA